MTMTLTLDSNPPVTVGSWTSTGPQVEYVRSLTAVLPDPSWSHADSSGHLHRWADTDRRALRNPEALPTLVSSQRHVDCDGSCGGVCEGEGYTVTVWHCATCGEQVEPSYIPDTEAQTTGVPVIVGPPEFTLTVDRAQFPGAMGRKSWPRDGYRAELRLGDTAAVVGRAWVGEVEWGSEGERWVIYFVQAFENLSDTAAR